MKGVFEKSSMGSEKNLKCVTTYELKFPLILTHTNVINVKTNKILLQKEVVTHISQKNKVFLMFDYPKEFDEKTHILILYFRDYLSMKMQELNVATYYKNIIADKFVEGGVLK